MVVFDNVETLFDLLPSKVDIFLTVLIVKHTFDREVDCITNDATPQWASPEIRTSSRRIFRLPFYHIMQISWPDSGSQLIRLSYSELG